jgi:general secretion pathway protein I
MTGKFRVRGGFTLIEVLVALVILAIALAAATRAATAGVDSARDAKARLAANVVVKNRIASLQTLPQPSDIGTQTGSETQLGMTIRWQVTIGQTPNALIRRAVATAAAEDDPARTMATLTAYIPTSGASAAR